MKREKAGAIRVARFEVTNLDKPAFQRWMALSDDCRGIVNCVWETWLLWHRVNGSAATLKAWLNIDAKTRGPRPVHPIPPACGKAIYDRLAAEFPNIESSARELLRNKVQGKINNLKAAKGNLSGWMAILFYHQSLPSTVRGNPIPFSKKNATIEPPAEEGKNWRLNVRVSRTPPAEGRKSGSSTLDAVELWTRGRKCASQLAILKRIATGAYEFCGSDLVWSQSARKWFAMIAYRMPILPPVELDSGKVAVLTAASITSEKPHPWRLRMPGANRWPGGLGECVAAVRRRLVMERKARNNGSRFAGSCRKGHGRKKATDWDWKLRRVWKDFVKSCNYAACKDVVEQCVAAGCGRLVYFQPSGAFRDKRYLTVAGKVPGIVDGTGWDWFQVGTRLSQLCEVAGIHLEIRKGGEPRSAGDKRPQRKASKNVMTGRLQPTVV